MPSRPPAAGSDPIEGLLTANPTASGTQIASAARIMSGHGSGAGFGCTSSASQSGTTAARTAAARVLIGARLRSPLIAAHLLAVTFVPNGPCLQPQANGYRRIDGSQASWAQPLGTRLNHWRAAPGCG